QFKPLVAQLKIRVSAESIKHPVAPPVYRPQPVPKVLQTKSSSAPSPRAAQVPRQPVAPPVYRPQATLKAAQSKMPSGARAVLAATTHGTSAPAKTANSVRPITAKTTASTFRAVQLAAARAADAEEMQVHRVSKARTPAIYWFTFDAIENH